MHTTKKKHWLVVSTDLKKYESNWIISQNRNEHTTYFKPPPRSGVSAKILPSVLLLHPRISSIVSLNYLISCFANLYFIKHYIPLKKNIPTIVRYYKTQAKQQHNTNNQEQGTSAHFYPITPSE